MNETFAPREGAPLVRCAFLFLFAALGCGAPTRPSPPHAAVPATPPVPMAAGAVTAKEPAAWTLASPQAIGDVFFFGGRTRPVVALADGERGFVQGGARHRLRGDALTRVVEREPDVLEHVFALHSNMGAPFVFIGRAGVYTAPTFDGALRKIASRAEGESAWLGHAAAFVGKVEMKPQMIGNPAAVKDAFRAIRGYDLRSGKPRGMPLGEVFVHPDGFSVALTLSPDKPRAVQASFSKDGATYTPLPLSEANIAYVEGDHIVVANQKEVVHVRRDGRPQRVDDVTLADTFARSNELVLGRHRAGREPTSPIALVEDGWLPAPGRPSTFITVEDGKLVSFDAKTKQRSDVALALDGREGTRACVLRAQGDERLVTCEHADGGKTYSYEVHRLEPGPRLVRERRETIDVAALPKDTFVDLVAIPKMADAGLYLSARTCEGATSYDHACVRRPGGTWKTIDRLPLPALTAYLRFDRGYVLERRPSEQALVVRDVDTGAETLFPAAALQAVSESMGANGRSLFTAPTERGAAIPRRGLLRHIYGNGPLGGSLSGLYVVDFDMATARVSVRAHLLGDVTYAGARMLHLHEGKLRESNDAGGTWTDIEPTPAGVPDRLDACGAAGCITGAFVRLGWSLP